ncbi:DNA-directed RNA polymerase subunit beta' [Patescibacteria group bacterium]|nr:MAG: DNA-directed RNA polymerase subunit beta' [Patescibacteria group bacterium]
MQRDNLHLADFDAIRLKLASPEVIRSWSFGDVHKPETINYRTQKPEKGGLFAEEIFGPTKDWECYCGKYKKIRYKGIICDKCGVEVTHSSVRRERMGHIELSAPVAHIWFLRSVPSKVGLVLDLSAQALEKVIYFASFIITRVDESLKKEASDLLRQEYKSKKKQIEKEAEKAMAEANDKKQAASVLEKIQKEAGRKLEALDADFQQADKDLKELQVMRIISENKYQELSLRYGHIFEASIGAEAVRNLLERINVAETIKQLSEEQQKSKGSKLERIIRRRKVLKSFASNAIRPEWMIMQNIPVVPPDLRPMVALDGGRFATSDLNDLYRRVINRNNRLRRLLELDAPEVICRNEKRMLQEAVDALIDNNARHAKTVTASTGQKRQLRSLADILKGKQGRFRQNLLGKRVDYSGRSVIVVGPKLDMDECGLPKRMALELFKPFIMSEVIKRELAHNVRSASRFIEAENDEVWDILEELTKKTRVLLNRAPTLHRLGIQAFHPRLIEGKAIQLHPLVCTAFNADFDGDQMAVHLPLTAEARWEADNLMAAERNLLKPATGSPVITPKQDIALGCYYLTRLQNEKAEAKKFFGSEKEAIWGYRARLIGLQEKIKVRFAGNAKFAEENALVETSVGRILFNQVVPEKLPFFNETIGVKKLGHIIRLCMELLPSAEEVAAFLDNLKNMGYRYVTKSGYSLGMDDFPSISEKPQLIGEADVAVQRVEQQYQEGLLTQSERLVKILEIWADTKNKVVAKNQEALDAGGPVYAMIDSGARGTWGQLGQVIGMKGLVASPSGETIELPVKSNFKEGFDVLEFFISSHGTRKGLSDTALRTANAGYLTRRLVDVSQDVLVLEEDCGDKNGEIFTQAQSKEMGEKLSDRVWGRYVLADVKDGRKTLVKAGEMIDDKAARAIEEAKIEEAHVRSVLQCRLQKGVCRKCYGFDLGHNKPVEFGTAVGIVAAQSIGEPGTQLTMRTFHTGGIASESDITQGLPRVDELFEARAPKRQAVLAEVDGEIEVEEADGKIITSATGKKIFEGRRGQKIVHVHFSGMDEMKIKSKAEDEVLVKDGAVVKKDEVLVVRGSSGEEIAAKYPGTVKIERSTITLTYEGPHVRDYIIPLGYKLMVKSGDKAAKGARLTDGSINLHQLFELKGREAVQRYILEEVQNIYSSQGQKVNDKHVELIIRQMFSRVYVEDAGDTDLLPGEVVEKAQLDFSNRQAKKDGSKPAAGREMFLGISRVALSTQSFLSAASFQETAKVLINTSITGKIDYLEGLKENVIIGRLIPAGTGYKP